MKIYQVTYEKYYDDFGGGGVSTEGSWLYRFKDNATNKVAEIKPQIQEEIKKKFGVIELEKLENTIIEDTPECYSIQDDSSMTYWGSSVFITEKETED